MYKHTSVVCVVGEVQHTRPSKNQKSVVLTLEQDVTGPAHELYQSTLPVRVLCGKDSWTQKNHGKLRGKYMSVMNAWLASYKINEGKTTLYEVHALEDNLSTIEEMVGGGWSHATVIGKVERVAPITIGEDSLYIHKMLIQANQEYSARLVSVGEIQKGIEVATWGTLRTLESNGLFFVYSDSVLVTGFPKQ